MDPESVFFSLLSKGVVDRIPRHLFMSYRAYGFMNHKLFIDLDDVSNIHFDWDKLETKKPEDLQKETPKVLSENTDKEVVSQTKGESNENSKDKQDDRDQREKSCNDAKDVGNSQSESGLGSAPAIVEDGRAEAGGDKESK